jgi:hypothetical protein
MMFLCQVKKLRSLKDVDEDILAEIFGLCFISQDSSGDADHYLTISTEKQTYGVFRTTHCLDEKDFIT